MTIHNPPKLYVHKHYVTDKETFMLDDNGARYGETPNIIMDADTPELAQLIAAAPELLNALKRLEYACEHGGSEELEYATKQARAVIAKAEGRA